MNRKMRKKRIRAKIFGTVKKPRLCFYRSLKSLYAQVIDDGKGKTLVSTNTKEAKAGNNVEGAEKMGKLIAKKCKEKKISNVVFDRSGYKYHGKTKAFADGAKKEGLKF